MQSLDSSKIKPLKSTIDHVAIAVANWSAARDEYAVRRGASMIIDAVRVDQRITQYRFANGAKLETLSTDPQGNGNSGIDRFLARHGEAFHHLTLKVPSVRDAMSALERAGYSTTGVDVTTRTRHEAYLPVGVSGNIPIQLLWLDVDDLTWARRRGFEPESFGNQGDQLLEAIFPHPNLTEAQKLWTLLGANTYRRTAADIDRLECSWPDGSMILTLDSKTVSPILRWASDSRI